MDLLMKSLRNFLGLLVFSSTFLILSCASDQTPAKNDSTKNAADVLNEQISIELNSLKATWVDSAVPNPPVLPSSQSNLNLEPGNSVQLSLTLQNNPTQNFDLLLRFGDGKVGYFELTGLSPSILSGGNQISLSLKVPETICDSLYPIRHEISLNFLTIEAGNTSDVQTVSVNLNCSMTIQ
jgi:hypothetical protein